MTQLWRNSPFPDVYSSLPSSEQSGWICQPDGTYGIDWKAAEVQKEIQHTMNFLLKGCGCTKGCKTLSCGCCKKQSLCGPGCLCQGCTNVHNGNGSIEETQINNEENNDDNSSEDSDEIDGALDSSDDILQTEVISDNFEFLMSDRL